MGLTRFPQKMVFTSLGHDKKALSSTLIMTVYNSGSFCTVCYSSLGGVSMKVGMVFVPNNNICDNCSDTSNNIAQMNIRKLLNLSLYDTKAKNKSY